MRSPRLTDRQAGRMYEIPCLICAGCVALAVGLPWFLNPAKRPAEDVAPVGSIAAIGSR